MREFSFCDDGKESLVEFHAYCLEKGEAEELFRELWGAWKDDPHIRFSVLCGDDIAGRYAGDYEAVRDFIGRLGSLGFLPEGG